MNSSSISGAPLGARLDRTFASLAAALIGDAMGSATEMLTPTEVRRRFGYIRSFQVPGTGTFANGRKPGQLTDDGAQLIGMARLLARTGGAFTAADVAKVILDWAADPELLRRFAGPSSRKAIHLLKDGHPPEKAGAPEPVANDLRSSNGAAMKVAACGLAFPFDGARAVEAATTMCVPTHNSDIAFAGAGAVAAAVAAACAGNASPIAVAEAGIRGAALGRTIGREHAHEVPGPSVAARIEVAIEIAERPTAIDSRIQRLNDVIGGGLPVAETVPFAIGLFVANGGDPMGTILSAVNLGNDSDTVATIAGAIAGAWAGSASLDTTLVAEVSAANDLRLASLARELCAISADQEDEWQTRPPAAASR